MDDRILTPGEFTGQKGISQAVIIDVFISFIPGFQFFPETPGQFQIFRPGLFQKFGFGSLSQILKQAGFKGVEAFGFFQ